MATPMSEMARVYLSEFALLQEARTELERELNKMWTMICDEVAEQLEETAAQYGRKLRSMDEAPNKSSPGDYWIASAPNEASLHVRIRDPRQSLENGKYTVDLYFPKNAQTEMRQVQGAIAEFEKFVKDENLPSPPLKWKSAPPWSKTIEVKVENVEDTVSEIGDVVLRLYRIIAQFEQWLLKQPKR
ncbi:MAG: hypothetical protein FJ395_19005 [Verrucomicrobia bacterium]|nr:hypothetical protein [Verrucomicrobiota bacterium]